MGKMFVFGALLALGCAKGESVDPVEVEPLAPPAPCDGISLDVYGDLVEPAENAAELWNEALGYEALCVEPGNGGLPVWQEELEPVPPDTEPPFGITSRLRGTKTAVMLRVHTTAPVDWTLLHEFGHVLGADHTHSGLMADRAPAAELVVDIEAVSAVTIN